MKRIKLTVVTILCLFSLSFAHDGGEQMLNLNNKEREQWFTDLGFGMFIHWTLDVQYGFNISHSLRMSSDDYAKRYFSMLPKTFNPEDFDPAKMAKMAKMSGMTYVVFTAKHHNGFCMWDTKTTEFNIMNTPYKKDIVKEVFDAFRKEGIAIGLYFSPDDFWFLHSNGYTITRNNNTAKASHNEKLNQYDKKQLRELLTNYGKIDILFLDGNDQFGKTELAKVAWEMDPNIVVTRGAMETPEQEIPDAGIPSPWESCMTLSESWSYRPTNEAYKTAAEAIMNLIEVKAKGGNLLLNIGPDELGQVPPMQKGILNEIGAWWFINHEVLENTKRFTPARSKEGYYMLQSKDEKDLYIVVPGHVERKKWKTITIDGLKIAKNAEVSLLGQGPYTSESKLEDSERATVENTKRGIMIRFVFLHNLYNMFRVENRWNNPVVLKIKNYK